jgi:hypothetical protein
MYRTYRKSTASQPAECGQDRMLHLDVCGTMNGIEVIGTLDIDVVDGRVCWFINGRLLLATVDGGAVLRSRGIADRLARLAVEPDEAVENAFKYADAIVV